MKVTIVIGEICSGKTTYSNSLKERIESIDNKIEIVDVGSIVRELTAIEDRVFNKDLDTKIVEKLTEIIFKNNLQQNIDLIIVGIRQTSIFHQVEEFCKNEGIKFKPILLEVPVEIRSQRYEERNAAKDHSIVFEIADQKDKELGLFSLIQYVKHRKDTLIVQNY